MSSCERALRLAGRLRVRTLTPSAGVDVVTSSSLIVIRLGRSGVAKTLPTVGERERKDDIEFCQIKEVRRWPWACRLIRDQ